VGLPCTLAANRLLAQQLFELSPRDPVTLAGVALGLLVVAVLAAWVPARRAMQVDAMTALRHE
jgi:ABC-type lipoprotein release transport system permease subunit